MRRLGGAVVMAALLTGMTGQVVSAAPGDRADAVQSGGAQSGGAQPDGTQVEAEEGAAQAESTRARRELRQAMDDVVAAGGAGVVVRVHDGKGDWVGSAGRAELHRSAEPVPTGRFRAGSITKTFVATVVMQLVDERKVSLDDPVARHLPRFGVDPRITVRMLLQHTSGLFNYTGDVKPDGTADPGIPMWGQEYVDNLFRTYRAEELVRSALAKPARFEPGARHAYSNTNYLLLGLLIEKVTGTGYDTQVERRILQPLGLRDSSLPGTRTGITGPHAHSYFGYQHDGRLKVVDITRMNPSWAGAAGEIITSTRDLDRFISALLGGQLVSPSSLAGMRETVPAGRAGRIGLGLFETEFAPGCTAYGHTGGTQSVTSYMYSTPDRARRVEFSINHGTIDAGDPAQREKFGKAQEKLAATALCGPSGR
ncbi:serine hydrolase domain-containing protein [Saccharothrix australiensis]|uniref:D-alanyl-D-alanine carboxypeptidase n=1 Tax=Saccharothrix australiensis TaxID=2072 RepID=A0A495VRU4_9PSEU|nr:serine hydrolase domain-containing protein [Saccharothrix australiensis]RKT52032.1 D-alanyl-D-alanine carboxypeptidase [Saccharothrix australiensis]